jgi:methylase of polypeptide subunit release factors
LITLAYKAPTDINDEEEGGQFIMDGFDVVYKLTSAGLSESGRDRIFKDFAQALGWEPSDKLNPGPDLDEFINGHLIVDHGLDNSAVITFLINPTTFTSLKPEQIKQILSVSYNNLIDWHIWVEQDKVTYVFNRSELLEPRTHSLSRSDTEWLKASLFDQITGAAPNPNFPTLDDALVENISFWKRNLAAELQNNPKLSDYAALFNSLIFVRAVEDHRNRMGSPRTRVLVDEFEKQQVPVSLSNVIQQSLVRLVDGHLPKALFSPDDLSVFDTLKAEVIYDLIQSFYKSRKVPYPYDFAIMSKHALSRIYEHYVSILSFEESSQLSFLPLMPSEKYSKSFGSIYTPQFIAKFFAKYLREQLTPGAFRRMKILDPACGSGIFLRTLLELQNNSTYDGASSLEISGTFENVKGIDIDVNAAQATKLSLSLLYLVLMDGELPQNLDIISEDALNYVINHNELNGTFDTVVANPPFISSENQNEETRKIVSSFLGELYHGKVDTFLPFIKLGVDALKPGGFGMFVLPHTFLKQESAEKVRTYLQEKCWIRCLVDLSSIPVFRDRGAYVILIIFQKKPEDANMIGKVPSATLVLCRDLVGHALQDCILGRLVENEFYNIYEVGQNKFADSDWIILPPLQSKIKHKLTQFSPLKEFLQVNQGIVTGADDIFIVNKSQTPQDEHAIWPQLLRDRDMMRFLLPRRSQYCVLYPFYEGKWLTEKEIQEIFPDTWDYLASKKKLLVGRNLSGNLKWWSLYRPRDPKLILGSKIITPHLVLLPKFSYDEEGKFVVSHGPYLSARNDTDDNFMKFFLGILNSSIGAWLISIHSDKYSRGYARLEVKTLSSIPVPDPSKIPIGQLENLLGLVTSKTKDETDLNLDKEIDKEVANLYNLTDDELSFGLGLYNA